MPTILRYAQALVDSIEAMHEESIVVNDLFARFAYAVVSDLVFARSSQTLDDKKLHEGVALIEAGMDVVGLVSPAPWLTQLLFGLPGITYSWNRMRASAETRMQERLKVSIQCRGFTKKG